MLVSRIDGDGRVTRGPLVAIDTSQGKPSELCWLQVTSDNSLVLATNFGYGTVSTYRLVEGRLSLLQDRTPPTRRYRATGTSVGEIIFSCKDINP